MNLKYKINMSDPLDQDPVIKDENESEHNQSEEYEENSYHSSDDQNYPSQPPKKW